MVEAAAIDTGDKYGPASEADPELFPTRFYEPESFVSPDFASVIDRYY